MTQSYRWGFCVGLMCRRLCGLHCSTVHALHLCADSVSDDAHNGRIATLLWFIPCTLTVNHTALREPELLCAIRPCSFMAPLNPSEYVIRNYYTHVWGTERVLWLCCTMSSNFVCIWSSNIYAFWVYVLLRTLRAMLAFAIIRCYWLECAWEMEDTRLKYLARCDFMTRCMKRNRAYVVEPIVCTVNVNG